MLLGAGETHCVGSVKDAMTKQILGKKVGMTQFFAETGEVYAATAVYCPACTVVSKKTLERDGYKAVVIAFEEASPQRLSKPVLGQFKGINAHKYLREIIVDDSIYDSLEIGASFDLTQFSEGDPIDVQGYSKGKGFAGTVKRHNFSRGPTTHGHDHHRAPGSIGATTTPGRVFKGMRMSGHMGNRKVSVLGQLIMKIDPEAHIIYVKGSVPGARHTLVRIQTSVKA